MNKFWLTHYISQQMFSHAQRLIIIKAIQLLQLGIRDGGSSCYRNSHLIAVASYSALEIISFQGWNLPVVTKSTSPDYRDKHKLLLQVPSPEIITDWPAHLFPTQGDFGRQIKNS